MYVCVCELVLYVLFFFLSLSSNRSRSGGDTFVRWFVTQGITGHMCGALVFFFVIIVVYFIFFDLTASSFIKLYSLFFCWFYKIKIFPVLHLLIVAVLGSNYINIGPSLGPLCLLLLLLSLSLSLLLLLLLSMLLLLSLCLRCLYARAVVNAMLTLLLLVEAELLIWQMPENSSLFLVQEFI